MPNDLDAPTSTRRSLILAGGAGLGGAALASHALAAQPSQKPPQVDVGTVAGSEVSFPSIQADTERPTGPPPNPEPPARRVGFAIMGLGRLALENILPAFAQCKHARPTALISGDPDKMRAIAAQYGIAADSCYSYGDFARIRDNPAVDVVYVVLPNALHRDAVVQAAGAGKHVLCEKPMATSPQEAREMIEACRRAGRKLMIAYRCQYEVNNKELARRARAGEFGQIQLIDAVNTQNQGDPDQWRQVRRLSGGGSLPDVGLYCLNTARALLGEEPIEVSAAIHSPPDDPRFREVESTVSFTLHFPSGAIANCASSYSAHEYRSFRVLGAAATADLENAFAYEGQKLRVMRRDGQAEADIALSLAHKNQFSLEIDHMAQCIRTDALPRTPGEEGLQDQILMAAIYEAARTGRPVRLAAPDHRDAFRGPEPQAS
ncbi:MAG: Gfo/Idh/MocA family protein [Caulobacteraceae bacterium]